jgi:hypothetical protein
MQSYSHTLKRDNTDGGIIFGNDNDCNYDFKHFVHLHDVYYRLLTFD